MTHKLPLETVIDENDDTLSEESRSNEKTNRKISSARIIRSVWFNKEKDPEKHYCELIMLFISCRNEKTDLIPNCSSYKA